MPIKNVNHVNHDEYYIWNASMVDLRIALLTLKVLFRRSGASDHAIANFGGSVRIRQTATGISDSWPMIQIPRPTERPGKTRLREQELPSNALGRVSRAPLRTR